MSREFFLLGLSKYRWIIFKEKVKLVNLKIIVKYFIFFIIVFRKKIVKIMKIFFYLYFKLGMRVISSLERMFRI